MNRALPELGGSSATNSVHSCAEASSTRLMFSRNFREARKACGFSQTLLANRSGIHRTVVSEIERGRHNPTVDLVDRLATIVGRTVRELLTEEGTRQREKAS